MSGDSVHTKFFTVSFFTGVVHSLKKNCKTVTSASMSVKLTVLSKLLARDGLEALKPY